MKSRFLTLAMVLISSSAVAFEACGAFKFTNNLQENLYVAVDLDSRADFCSGQWLPQVIPPGQTVAIPIAAGKQPFIDFTTERGGVKIDANYFLRLSFQNGQYDFNDELNTQAFSWSNDRRKLAFCTDQTFADSAGNCFLFNS